jgi:lysophospholipase L1-like esterase
MKIPTLKKALLGISLMLNLVVSIPALILVAGSSSIQFDLYQNILAARFGEPKIVFIGDSITRGGGVWAPKIGEWNLNVWNWGHGGFTTRQIHHYAKRASEYESIRYAFVMAGINDPDKSAVGAEKSFEDYKNILETLSASGITPVIQLTLYREKDKNPEFVSRLNELLKEYASTKNIPVIDLNAILAPENSLLPEYSRDGVHLTQAAYAIWSNEIRKFLEQMKKSEQDSGGNG